MTSSDLSRLGRLGDSLLRTVEAGRLSPSYLFEGADHDLVREAAMDFAALVLGAEVADSHPDLHVQERDKATVISVEALTAVLEAAHDAPIAGRYQVFLIDPAEAMDARGVARYLKALEEPPGGTVFVLVSTRADRLPDTVLSRVQRIRIPPGSINSIRARLLEDGAAPADADTLARWSGGSLARARRYQTTCVPDVVRALAKAAASPEPRAAAVVETVLASLGQDAALLAEQASEGRKNTKSESMRVLLVDALYALSVEARDLVAERTDGLLFPGLGPDAGLRLLERFGTLAAAVPSNVTPAVVLLETVRALRAHVGPKQA